MLKLALIFLGAGVGGVLRYWLGGVVQHASGWTFPAGTMFVNVSGCLVIGVLAVLFTGRLTVSEPVRDAILIGVLGGYTTFSSFGRETMALLDDRQFTLAAVNVLVSVAAGLAATWIGMRLTERLFGVGAP